MTAFLEAIGAQSSANRVMSLQWRGAGWLRVERRPPEAAASGKILHLHQSRRPSSAGPPGQPTRAALP